MIHYMTTQGVGDAWVGNELRVLAARGVPFALHALKRPEKTYFRSPDIAALDRQTQVLYPLPKLGLLLSLAAAPFLFGMRFFQCLWNALTGPRESLEIRLKTLGHLAVACHWARGLRRQRVSWIHSQWIHSGGSVAMYGAWLLGVPFSFTGHAADLFRERAALQDKVRRAAFIACISSFHRDLYLELGASPEKLRIVYCGIDTRHFQPGGEAGSEAPEPLILAAGRLVDKKGFAQLVAACRLLLDRGIAFRCILAGSGPLEAELRAQIRHAGLESHIELTGEALRQEDIPAFMASGAVFCLPCVRAPDGDVDGLPQLLMEAMACGLPVVTTRIAGIPDLVRHDETGLLTQPGDSEGLAEALETLLADPERSALLAKAGRAHVERHFGLPDCLDPLVQEFRAGLARS